MQALQQRRTTWGLLALSAVLLAGAVAVRGMGGSGARRPLDAPAETGVSEPLQLLGSGARFRLGLDWPHVPADHRARWRSLYPRLFSLQGCPRLTLWLQGPDGQSAETLIHALERGSADERLTATALIFQLARVTTWEPSLRRGSADAVRLGGLLESHLGAWAGAAPAGYEETIVASLLLYGRAMRAAWDAPMVGHDEATLARARSFLARYLGYPQGPQGPGSQLLRRRHPLAWEGLGAEDALDGLDTEARRLFPDLDGECGR